jgi:hypothetical protein
MPPGKALLNQRLPDHHVSGPTIDRAEAAWSGEAGRATSSRKQTYGWVSKAADMCSARLSSRAATKNSSSTCAVIGCEAVAFGSFGRGAARPGIELLKTCSRPGSSSESLTSWVVLQSIPPATLSCGSLLAWLRKILWSPFTRPVHTASAVADDTIPTTATLVPASTD